MIRLLAQATQPAADLTHWTPTAVITVVTVIVGLVTASLIPSIISLVNSIRAAREARAAMAKASEANQQSAENRGAINAQSQSIDRLAVKTDKALLAIDPNKANPPPPMN